MINYRRTKKLYIDNRVVCKFKNIKVAFSIDKNNQICEIETSINDEPYTKVRNKAYDHYKGRDLSLVDINYITAQCYE